MKRSWHVWLVFVGCLAVVLAAMGWISLKALGLERAETEALQQEALARQLADEARRQATLEQEARLALWQMDYALTPLVAQESVRPYFVYSTFLPVDRAYRQMFNAPPGRERLVPSPLLNESSPDILVHFQFESDGRLTSPRVPDAAIRPMVVPELLSQQAVEEAEAHLARIAATVDRDELLAVLPENTAEPLSVVFPPFAEFEQQRRVQAQFREDTQNFGRGIAEYNRRNDAVQNSANTLIRNQDLNQFSAAAFTSTDLGGVLMTPLWIDGHLFLARRISASGREYVQGCLLNWPAIRKSLLLMIEDQLPEADLQPVPEMPEGGGPRLLSALPVRLIPGGRVRGETVSSDLPAGRAASGRFAVEAAGPFSPIRLSLLIAWACVLLAAVAVATLLSGVIRLSERRAAFVSAVTHELRTPLTTFHMYTEMLAEGMVPDRAQQRQYLGTLRSEASRLTHLVENVLAYARLERGRSDGRIEDVPLERLLEPIQSRLADRARRDGMEVVVEADEAAGSTVVRANPSAVEQILFNLVDNAGKYAAGASDKRIHLMLGRSDGAVQLRVRDHGPGIPPTASRRLFRSFSKSAHDAANSAPGVGLGLALSRRLARGMGGRLWLDRTVADGACFVLTLPVSSQSAPR